ncbi:MAG: hypothetical protein QW076_05905 [Candidatus Anstonellales archaeon]
MSKNEKMSFSDKIFLTVSLMILIAFIWLRFLEEQLTIWFSIPLYVMVAYLIFKWPKIVKKIIWMKRRIL